MKLNKTKILATLLLGTALGTAIGGISVGQASNAHRSPMQASIFYACLDQSSGALSQVGVSSAPACPSGSDLVHWNIKGEHGAPGAPGAKGDAGSTGPVGPAGPAASTTQGAAQITKTLDISSVYRSVDGAEFVEGDGILALSEGTFNLSSAASSSVDTSDSILGCSATSVENGNWLIGPFNQDAGRGFTSTNSLLGTLQVGPGGGSVALRCKGIRELPSSAGHVITAVVIASPTTMS
ncbi:MAG: collagen-like protein [Actinobacteria bacterium]|nr:collagen-like protein [Actinomycetota bacterium]